MNITKEQLQIIEQECYDDIFMEFHVSLKNRLIKKLKRKISKEIIKDDETAELLAEFLAKLFIVRSYQEYYPHKPKDTRKLIY